jgi:hypothetical protein
MNKVELILDETLADFEVQDWIDNVFSVQYPDIQATIKKGCQGNCGDKYKEENEQLKQKLVGKENEFKYFSNSFQSKIKELQKQIEKMKCCDNCFNQFDEYQCRTCQNKSNWSLAE